MNKKTTFFQKHKKTLIAVTIIVALVFGVRSVSSKNKTIPKGKEEKTTTVKRQDIKNSLKLSGVILAEEDATVRFQGSGLLTWVGVKEGDTVKKWQALASLDTRSLKKTLKKEMNDYLSERWDFEQTQDDYEGTRERHLLTDEMERILDKAQFDLESIVLDYELADLAVRLSTITSPINGIVTLVEQPFSGVNVTPATAEIRIINPETTYFSAEVDEEEVSLVAQGMSAIVTIDSYEDQELESQITYISLNPISTGTTVSYQAKLSIPEDNSNLKYRMGMSGDAHITLGQKENVLTVPIRYLNEKGDRTFVLVKKDGKIEEKDISVGLENDIKVEVLEGLEENDEIVYYE